MKKTLSAFLLSLFLLSLFPGCGEEKAEATLFVMDTASTLRLEGGKAEEALSRMKEELTRLDALLDAEGEVLSSLGRGEEVRNGELAALLRETLRFSRETGGALDVTVNPAVEAWGFRSGNYRVPSSGELSALKEYVGWEKLSPEGDLISLPGGFSLTLGAVAKGYAGDRLRAIAGECGVKRGVLSLGGNVVLIGEKQTNTGWSVAVRAPEGGYALTLSLSDAMAVTSGSYERYFEKDGKRYHHILDPQTLSPAENGLLSVTVVSKNGLLADALSTALFVMGPEKAAEHWRTYGESEGFEILLLTGDHRILASKGIVPHITGFGEGYGELVIIE